MPRQPTPSYSGPARASIPVGTAADARLRAHWSWLLVPFVAYVLVAARPDVEHPAAWTAAWTAALFASVLTHEVAHAWVGRSIGLRTREIVLSPIGVLVHQRPTDHVHRDEALLAIAGPLSHALWFVVSGSTYFLFVQGTPRDAETWAAMLRGFLALQVALVALNLVPFWPLDGARILRAVLARRTGAAVADVLVAWAGIAGATITGLAGLAMILQGGDDAVLTTACGPALCVLGVACFFASRGLLAEAREAPGPLDAPDPWHEPAPSGAWSLEDATPAEPVAVEELRPARTAVAETSARQETVRAPARPLAERIDELLDRINEVGGVENLTEAERRELREASELLKRGS